MNAQPNYEYWENALAGKFGPVHDGDPQCGFYRKRLRKAGPFVPVAIFPVSGTMSAVVAGKAADAAEIWTYCCEHPVPEQWYRDVAERGLPWPDLDETVAETIAPMGHNNGPTDDAEILAGQIESAAAGVSEYETIADDTVAAKAQSLRSRLLELCRDADKKRDELKRPHLEAGGAVDAKWQPIVKVAKAAADKIAAALGAHETRKVRAAEEAARKAAEEQRKREAEAAKANKPPPPPAPVPEAPAPVTAIRGAYGRAASVRIVKVATVTDYDAACHYLILHPEMIALIDRLAQRGVEAGHTIPGVSVEEQRKVS